MKISAKYALCCAAVLLGTMAAPAQAQTYPARPMTVLFPYPPGPDVALRALTGNMEKSFGQSIIIDHRTGGNEVPATQALLNFPADGYTILCSSQNFSLNPAVQKLSYQQNQFAYIAQFAMFGTPFGVRADFPAKNLQELLAYAKANPGKVTFSTVGNYEKLSWLILAERAGIQITQVPFRGGPDVIAAVSSGIIDVVKINLAQMQALAKADKIRILAVTSQKRVPELPELPAMSEAVPGFSVVFWQGLFARAGTPRPIIDRWNAGLREALKTPEIIKIYQNLGYTAVSQTPEEMAEYVKRETETLGRAAKQAGIVPE